MGDIFSKPPVLLTPEELEVVKTAAGHCNDLISLLDGIKDWRENTSSFRYHEIMRLDRFADRYQDAHEGTNFRCLQAVGAQLLSGADCVFNEIRDWGNDPATQADEHMHTVMRAAEEARDRASEVEILQDQLRAIFRKYGYRMPE